MRRYRRKNLDVSQKTIEGFNRGFNFFSHKIYKNAIHIILGVFLYSNLECSQIKKNINFESDLNNPQEIPQPEFTQQYINLTDITRNLEVAYHLPNGLIAGLIEKESSWQNYAISEVGAAGLMQLMAKTAEEAGLKVWTYNGKYEGSEYSRELKNIVKKHQDDAKFLQSLDDRFNPFLAIPSGTCYLVSLRDRFQNLETALSAYHVGPNSNLLNTDINYVQDVHEFKKSNIKERKDYYFEIFSD